MEQITISISEVFGWSIGVSALVAISISALWAIYFNRIKEGQKAEFQKQIEELKAKNDKLNYITKTQFDAEFKMYQELSAASYNMVMEMSNLFPKNKPILKDMQSSFKNNIKIFKDSINSNLSFQDLLFKYSAFISIFKVYIFEKHCEEYCAACV